MKTRPYANPLTALIEAARESSRVHQLALALSVAVSKHGGATTFSAPTAARRVLRDVEEATGLKAERIDGNSWTVEY